MKVSMPDVLILRNIFKGLFMHRDLYVKLD